MDQFAEPPPMIRVVTYNAHRCTGTDRRTSTKRIAEVIASVEPDIVALQEIDVRRPRTGGADQAQEIADELGMKMHFHPAFRVMEELYGDAILTSLPTRFVKGAALPGVIEKPKLEWRGAIWAAVEADGMTIQIINTHLGLLARERDVQVDCLLGPEWLGNDACTDPAILLGDFNAVPRSRAYRKLSRHLTDVGHAHGNRDATFPSRLPVLRLDHIFYRGRGAVISTGPVKSRAAKQASDHLPLMAEIEFHSAHAEAIRS